MITVNLCSLSEEEEEAEAEKEEEDDDQASGSECQSMMVVTPPKIPSEARTQTRMMMCP